MDLPHSNAGYLQAEETQFRNSIDTFVYSKMGKDINFLKDTADTTEASALSLFGFSNQCIFTTFAANLDVNGSFSGVVYTLSNLRQILFASVGAVIPSVYATTESLLAVQNSPYSRILFNANGTNYTQFDSLPLGNAKPYIQVNIIDGPTYDQLYVNIYGGRQNSIFGPTPYLPASGSFTLSMNIFFATT